MHILGIAYKLTFLQLTMVFYSLIADNVDNSLLDLYGVEFGELAEANSLLRPYMRAYCHSNPSQVEKLARELAYYGFAGAQAHFAYHSLLNARANISEGMVTNQDQWFEKMYMFLKETEVFKAASEDLTRGLQLYLEDDVRKRVIELRNVSVSQEQIIFSNISDFIMNKITNSKDWPDQCLLKVGGKRENTVVIKISQLLESKYTEYNDVITAPWKIPEIAFVTGKNRYFVRKPTSEKNKKSIDQTSWDNNRQSMRDSTPPDHPPKDRIIFITLRPRADRHPDLKPEKIVFVSTKNVYTYYDANPRNNIQSNTPRHPHAPPNAVIATEPVVGVFCFSGNCTEDDRNMFAVIKDD